jgi:outer membrane lipoprotein-sorting protein
MKLVVKLVLFSMTIFLLSLPVTHPTYSLDNSAVDLLKKAYSNQRLVSHTGTLKTEVFLGNKTSSSMVDIQQKEGKVRTDYKSGLSAGLSIIDDGKKTMTINSKNNTVVVCSIPDLSNDISFLLLNYNVMTKGTEKIAERQTQILQIIPKRKGNPSTKLWIDIKTFIILKREYYNSDNTLVSKTSYTKINSNTKINDDVFIPPSQATYLESDLSAEKTTKDGIPFSIFKPKYLPVGYVLEGYYLFKPPSGKGVRLRYTDGLNTISILEVVPPTGWHPMRWIWGRGRGVQRCRFIDNLQGRAIRIYRDKLNIAIVGDISENELQKIADNIK